MTRDDFLRLLEDVIETETGSLTESESLANLKGWDSLAVLVFISVVDEHFGFTPSAESIRESKSIHDLIALLGDSVTN
jgi:acyl carrier protein